MGCVFAVMLSFAVPASANHGSWTHHHNHYFESGSSNYGGYADVAAQNRYDFGHAKYLVYNSSGSVIRDESVTCGPVTSGCGYRKTTTVYWPQSQSSARSAACAKKGSHKLAGEALFYQPCAQNGTHVHRHNVSLS
jgi:hypothetical protein